MFIVLGFWLVLHMNSRILTNGLIDQSAFSFTDYGGGLRCYNRYLKAADKRDLNSGVRCRTNLWVSEALNLLVSNHARLHGAPCCGVKCTVLLHDKFFGFLFKGCFGTRCEGRLQADCCFQRVFQFRNRGGKTGVRRCINLWDFYNPISNLAYSGWLSVHWIFFTAVGEIVGVPALAKNLAVTILSCN